MNQKAKTAVLSMKRSLTEHKFLVKPALILSAVYFVALSAVLRSNFYYHDDIQRACWGWPGWGFSRHLSNFLSKFLHTRSYLSDISPLPQILAVFVISFTSVLAIYLITRNKQISGWQLISAIPIGLSPYFLECLSFKYDSPYMALSVLFAVCPLLLRKKHVAGYLLCTALGTIAMSSSYQASSGIFPMLVIIIGLQDWINGEKTGKVLRFYGISAVGYLLGLLAYRQFFMEELNAYATTAMVPAAELIPGAIANYKRYIVHFLTGFDPEWLILSIAVCVCFWGTSVAASRQNKIVSFLLIGTAMVLMFLLAFGVYPFLEEPLFYPRAMYGIGCFIAFLGICAVSNARKGYLVKPVCLLLSWSFFVFSFTYGNALNVQAQYTDFRITEAIDDLAECETLFAEDTVTLQITGSIGYAPGVENLCKEFRMIEKLIPVNFQGDGWWGEFGMRYYYGLPEFQFAESYDPPKYDLPLIADNYYHTIRADEDYIWIDLH